MDAISQLQSSFTYIGARDSTHKRTLTVGDVTNRADVDGRLTRDDLGVEWRDARHIEVLE